MWTLAGVRFRSSSLPPNKRATLLLLLHLLTSLVPSPSPFKDSAAAAGFKPGGWLHHVCLFSNRKVRSDGRLVELLQRESNTDQMGSGRCRFSGLTRQLEHGIFFFIIIIYLFKLTSIAWLQSVLQVATAAGVTVTSTIDAILLLRWFLNGTKRWQVREAAETPLITVKE